MAHASPGAIAAAGGLPDCGCTPALVTGNRSASITTTVSGITFNGAVGSLWVDGNTGNSAGPYASPDNQAVAGAYFQFDFGAPVKLTGAKWHLQSGGDGNSVWKWMASADGVTWEDIPGSAATFNQAVTQSDHPGLSSNTKGARYWRFVGVSGNLRHYYINEVEFTQCSC